MGSPSTSIGVIALGQPSPYDPGDLPTLSNLFGDESRISEKLALAGFSNVVEVMIITGPGLMMHGLSSNEVHELDRVLGRARLPHIGVSERRVDFVDQVFGSTQDAPIQILNTASLYNEVRNCHLVEFRPLRLLKSIVVASRWEAREQGVNRPPMTVGDLTGSSFDTIWRTVTDWSSHGPVIRDLSNEVYELAYRMSEWGLSLLDGPRLFPVPTLGNEAEPGIQ